MTLHELGAPALPVFEEIVEGRLAIFVAMAAKELACGGRSAGARIEKRDVHFAFGEGAVDKRKIADDGREKAEAESGFRDDENARERCARNDIAEAECEEGRTAEIDVRGKTGMAAGDADGGASSVLHETETEDQADSPDSNEKQKREWAIKAEQRFACFASGHEANDGAPGSPGEPEKETREAEFARHAAR